MAKVSNKSGGAAAAGGFSFQANLGCIASVHTIRGTPVQWTDGLTASAPIAVSFETSGPGDDLSLELADGSVVEIQVKKGLRADKRFWSAFDALCKGIYRDRCTYGILIVCPNSSVPVRRGYASALERIAAGRNDCASPEQRKLTSYFSSIEYDAENICARIRIRTVSALEDAGDAIAAARAELGHVIMDDNQITTAWHTLCQDSLSAIANRSRRNVSSLSACLSASGIDIQDTVNISPVAISNKLIRWTLSRTEQFGILGISQPLPTDNAWLTLTALTHDASIEQAPSAAQALANYQAVTKKSLPDGNIIDARTIGTFRKHCVVVGGPGSGKSLLLKVLGREFAKDSYVSIRIRLRDLATRMQETGCGVEEGLLQLGVDGTGVSQLQLRAASLPDLVLLCDGLDECGDHQSTIASGLKDISASHPSYRIVVTTRSIGYSTSELHNWRHYEILPLAEKDTAKHMATLCRCTLNQDSVDELSELQSRIHTYLEQSSASQLFARSPLLLAFGAALFLNWKEPCNSKLELYQRIFKLVDSGTTGHRSGLNPPTKAIRNSVLNELGWLITALPLSPAEELEDQCAQTIQQSLGNTRLQALAVVENCVKFWEEKGLIERLMHPGAELIVFIHKTCGEFAAARHLSEMKSDDAQQTVKAVLSNPDWNEILDFTTGTPLATTLARLLVAEFEVQDSNESALRRLFRVLIRPEASLSPSERKLFLEQVFAFARSDDRQKAYQVGLCLVESNLSVMPEAEQMADVLIASPKEWSRLIGWAILVCHFPNNVHQSDLEDALAHFMERSGSNDFFVLENSNLPFGLGPYQNRDIFESFMIGALNSLLPTYDQAYQEQLIEEVLNSEPSATYGFVLQFKALLRELGWEHESSPVSNFLKLPDFSISDRMAVGYSKIYTEVVPPAFLMEDSAPPLQTGLKYLAAFFKIAKIKQVPANDVYVWLQDESQLDAVHSLLRAAAYIFELPAERLAIEAKQVIEIFHQDGKTKWFTNVLPSVDVMEVDWSRAKECGIETSLVEDLVLHPSQWVQILATCILDQCLHSAERQSTCERLLAAGTGDALYRAAALTAELPDGCELLIHRLGGHHIDGLHHLYDFLRNHDFPVTSSHLPVLENGLINCDAKTAKSAARWCKENTSSTDTWLVDLLQSANNYWIEHEEPYPQNGGIVPNSPREAILRALYVISQPDFTELVDLAQDSRSDVRNAAIDGIILLVEHSIVNRNKLVNSIISKRFSSRQCETLLDSSISYNSEQISALCDLFIDPDPVYRLVAARYVLTHPSMNPERALTTANSMRSDCNGNVRDAIFKFLDGRSVKEGS